MTVTVVLWVLALVVVVLAVMVVGLLRSHAVIVRALHDAGINLDPDHDPDGSNGHRGTGSGSSPRRGVASASGEVDLRTIDGVPGSADLSGAPGHDFAGRLPNGGARTVSARGRESTLLAFLSSGCATCIEFWDAFDAGVDLPAGVRLVIVTKGEERESPSEVAALAPDDVLTVMSTDAWDLYGVPVAPYFALVDGASGVVVGEGAAKGWDLVQGMLVRAIEDGSIVRSGAQPQPGRRDVLFGRARNRIVDAELSSAGLTPGDNRLYHVTPFANEGGNESSERSDS